MIPPANHPAAAWLDGSMTPTDALEFEKHLAGCADCQAQIAQLRERRAQQLKTTVRRWRVVKSVAFAMVMLLIGFALGWWLWQLSHVATP